MRCKGFCSRLRVCRPCGVAAAAPHPKNVPPARFLHGLVPFGFESLAAHKNDFFPKNKNGIPTAVALLGLNNPIGIIFSGLFVAYLNQGGFNMQVYGFAPQVIDIIISVVIYFAAFSLLLRGFVERRVKRREEKRAADGRPAVSGRGPQEGGGAE